MAPRRGLDAAFRPRRGVIKDWYYAFMRRHPNISLRTPEQISMARAKAFNKTNVQLYFSNLDHVYQLIQYARDRIWNIDETGFPTVPTKVKKLLTEKGRKRVGQMTPAERGTNVTVAVAVSAAGAVIPPFFLFPSKNMMGRYMDNVSSECAGYANGSGWMQQSEFHKFMIHFVRHSNASKDKPTLLLLDNHVSHMSIAALDLAVEHGITILTLPPHCSHRLQSLDCGVFSVVKSAYVTKHASWTKNNAGKLFELHHVPPIVEAILDEEIRPDLVKKSFKRTGNYPFNPNIFTEEDFVAAEMCVRLEGNIDDQRVVSLLDPAALPEEVSSDRRDLEKILNSVGPVQPGEIRKKSIKAASP